jgi:predicted nucleic acid-binding protein
VIERHYWDTTSWLQLHQEHDGPGGPMRTLFGAVQRGVLEVLFSPVTIAEVLIKPDGDVPRPWPDPHEADTVFDTEGLVLVQVDRVIGERTRSLRRRFKLKTPDAIHLACALQHDVAMLVTTDGAFKDLPTQYCKNGLALTVATPEEALGGPLFTGR